MILKLKEIHQYTHQLVSSEEEEEAPSASCAAPTRPEATGPEFRPASCSQRVTFKAPEAVATEEAELLSASQGSNSSSGAASGESERWRRLFKCLRHLKCFSHVLLLFKFIRDLVVNYQSVLAPRAQ